MDTDQDHLACPRIACGVDRLDIRVDGLLSLSEVFPGNRDHRRLGTALYGVGV